MAFAVPASARIEKLIRQAAAKASALWENHQGLKFEHNGQVLGVFSSILEVMLEA